MYITRVCIDNFRNIRHAELEFDRRLNVFAGKNAQGKTNLMEALSVCLGGSFRRSRFSQFIPAGEKNADVSVRLWFKADNTERENIVEYTVSKNIVTVKHNGLKIKDAAELYGVLKYVVFIPEHLTLIKGQPELRRAYLDDVAVMQTRTHLEKLSRYNKGLRQRNIILGGIRPNTDPALLSAQLAPWNDVLAREGVNVTYGRLNYFKFLKEYAAEIYADLTGGAERLEMEYNSTVFNTESINFKQSDKLYTEYITRLEQGLEAEMKLRYTVTGVHRDDVSFFINGMAARDFASQGQLRSAALALKLSEAEMIRQRNKTRPVVILDDILSELDAMRREYVINHIDNSQVFITCCNINDLSALKDGKAWTTENGSFTKM